MHIANAKRNLTPVMPGNRIASGGEEIWSAVRKPLKTVPATAMRLLWL